MDFEIDEQTCRDLTIFRNAENAFSLFDLFKNTRTLGGRERMVALMKTPSNQIEELRRRTEAIAFFIKTAVKLTINHDQFDLILHYLNHDKGHLRANFIDAFIPWLANRIKSNQDYYVVEVGIKYLFGLLQYAQELSSSLLETGSPSLLTELAYKITAILEKPGISRACALSSKKKLTFFQLAELDSMLRKNNRADLLSLLDVFYELDVLETLAFVSSEKDFCLPMYVEAEHLTLQIDGLYHPAIASAVRNDIKMDERNNLTFLSGSNMAGKSSILKSIGTAIYLSHIGFPVPAKNIQTVVFNGLITTINLADNIENGLSHYYSEVMRVKKVASLLTERTRMFVILDELFKGTNTKDAFDASLLVLNGFSAISNSVFIISSHLTELTDQLSAKNISFNFLEHLMIDGNPHFTYQLKNGIAKDGIGMYFIEKEGIAALLEKAKNKTLVSVIARSVATKQSLR